MPEVLGLWKSGLLGIGEPIRARNRLIAHPGKKVFEEPFVHTGGRRGGPVASGGWGPTPGEGCVMHNINYVYLTHQCV